jgi:hypothetical protein
VLAYLCLASIKKAILSKHEDGIMSDKPKRPSKRKLLSKEIEPSKQSRGGQERAARLTTQQRREIARHAAQARWDKLSNSNEIPSISLPGLLPIGDVEIEVYRLTDGRRLISKRGMARALTLKSEGGSAFLRTVTREGVRSVIDEKLWKKIENPIVFNVLGVDLQSGNTPTADGYEATTLIDVCDALLRARQENKLAKSQHFLAVQAEIIIRATAKVGINKLVDQAVGYISDPRRLEYIEMFKAFVAEECQQWNNEFPDKLADMLYRLYNLKRFDPKSKKHPRFFAKFIRKYIYYPLANSKGVILEMLDEKNPVIYEKGGRRYKLYQFLEEKVGMTSLRAQIWQVIGIGAGARDRKQFDASFFRAFPDAVPIGHQWDLLDYDDENP